MLVAVGIETISALYVPRRRPADVHAERDCGGGSAGAAEKPAVSPPLSLVTAAGPDNQSKRASAPPWRLLLGPNPVRSMLRRTDAAAMRKAITAVSRTT
jgi:hypothetical protein